MEDKTHLSDVQAETAKAQLQKLNLEISALETEVDAKAKRKEEDHEKLVLEISSLRRQNGLLSSVTQFATVLTVLATITTIGVSIFSLWSGYDKFISDKANDTLLKKQQVLEETNKQYRAELQQLLQFPSRTQDTIPIAEFLLRDIHEVIEAGYNSEPATLNARRTEVGFSLSQLVKSPEFSLKELRNVDFDVKALAYSSYYSNYLIATPSESLDILSKYKIELVNLEAADPGFVSSVTVDGSLFHDHVDPRNNAIASQLETLFWGYGKHVDLLAISSEKRPADVDIKQKLNLSFCWFYGSTHNQQLTATIFRMDPTVLQGLWDNICQ